jgi:hypothetical protein
MEVAGKDVIDLEIVEIGKPHRHIPFVSLIAEIAPGKEGVEQLSVTEHNLFLVRGQARDKGMELMKDLFALRRLERDPPDRYILIFTWPVRIGENIGIFTEIHPAGIAIPVVIPWDKADPKAGVGEERADMGPEAFSIGASVKEVAADHKDFYVFFPSYGDEPLKGLPSLVAICPEMDIRCMEYLHATSTSYTTSFMIGNVPSLHFSCSTEVIPFEQTGWKMNHQWRRERLWEDAVRPFALMKR